MNLKAFLIPVLCLLSLHLFSQKGPGGVGTKDGSSALELWLKSDSLLQTPGGSQATSGDQVGEWIDQSGNNNDFIQSGANRPLLVNSGINGRSAVEFIGDGDFLEDSDGENYFNGLSELTVFFVVQSELTGNDRGFFDTRQPDGGDNSFAIRYDVGGASGGGSNVLKIGVDATGTDQQIETSNNSQTTNPKIIAVNWADGEDLKVFFDAAFDQPTFLGATATGSFANSTTAIIGKGPKDQSASDSWDGFIGEAIIYSSKLDTVDYVLVQNYLAAKFGIDISASGVDFYAFEASYGEDVAGIGQIGVDSHTNSNSSDLLNISTTAQSDLTDGNFMFLGHDGGNIQWTTTNIPNLSLGGLERINRTWAVDETTDIDTVKISLDTTMFSARPSGYSKFVLLVDEDGDGDFSNASTYEMQSPGGNEIYEIDLNLTDDALISFGAVNPSLGFTSLTQDEIENTDFSVSIFLNYIPINDLSFDLATQNISATGVASSGDFLPGDANTDYVIIPSTNVVFEAGSQQDTTFVIAVNPDNQSEDTESFEVQISNVSDAINVLQPLTCRINDDDNLRKIYFDQATSSVNEFTSSIDIQVNITPSQVDNTNPTTVDYVVTGGNAVNGSDYTLAAGTATIDPTFISTTFSVSITDDAIDENDETIEISLSNPTNASLSATEPITHTLTILDNDPGTQIQFNVASSSGDEGDATPSILVVLSSILASDASVDYTISGNSTSGSDYTLAAGTATITAGNISTTIDPVIIDDANSESDETLILTLENPSGAALGTITAHTFTIIDNDGEFGFNGPGGVGSNDGTSALSLWLDASAGVLNTGATEAADGEAVGTWQDRSGNGNDFVDAGAGQEPVFAENSIDGEFALDFDGTDDILEDADGHTNYINGISAYSLVAVVESDVIDTDKGFFDTEDPDGNDDLLSLRYDTDGLESGNDDAIKFGIDNGSDQQTMESLPNLQTTNPQIIVADWSSGSDVGLYVDGTFSVDFLDGAAVTGTLAGATKVLLGTGPKENDPGTDTWDGRVAELLMFTTKINEAQRTIIENYLAAKYNVTISNDLYAFDATHEEDVAGIGQATTDEFHDDAQSAGILRVNNPSNLNIGDYLFFGHDSTAVDAWTLNETPVDSIFRISREWAVDLTNYSGTVDIILSDPVNNLGALPASASGYVLLVDDNGDFSDGGTDIYEMDQDGSDYVYQGLSISSDSYITFGTAGITAFYDIASVSEDEGAGSYDITVNFSRSLTSDTDLAFSVNGSGTASEGGGNDFTITPSPLNVLSGSNSATITITLNDDTEVEIDETVIVDLVSATNDVFVRPAEQFTLTIQDNDAAVSGTTGPGGVRRADAFGMWLAADSAVYSDAGSTLSVDGDIASQWNDLTGNNNFATGVATFEPTFRDNVTDNENGRPVIQFDGVEEYMTIANSTFLNSTTYTEKTLLVSFQTGPDVSGTQVVYEQGGASNGLNVHIDQGEIVVAIWDNDWSPSYIEFTSTANINTKYIAMIELDANSEVINGFINGVSVGSISTFLNGQNDLDAHTDGIGIGYENGSTLVDGANPNPDYFSGKVLEVLSLNSLLNDAERIIIENYLAAKYNINISTGNDFYSYKTTFSYGIAGIGRTNNEFHTASKSDSLITISNPATLDNDEFLIIGHDNGDISSFVTTDIPSSDFERLGREWRISQTGNVGNVKITYDPSQTSATPGADFNQYAVIVDSDGDFTSGATVYTLFQNGSVFESSVINFSDGDYFTIAAFRPAIQFSPATVNGDESDSLVSVNVVLNYAVDGGVTVDYSLDLVNTTATQGSGPTDDFELADGTATIASGETSTSFTFDVNDDSDDTEGNEIVVIDLSNPLLDGGAGLFIGEDTTYTYTIEDNDLTTKVDWAVASSSVAENNGSIGITLKLNEIAGSDVTVDYRITGGTASSNNDFTLADGNITILSGNITNTLTIPLINDDNAELSETIELTLSNPVGANLGINRVHTLTITDADPDPEVRFENSISSGSEGSTPANIPVTLSLSSGKEITLDYSIGAGSATNGVDFNLTAGTLTFAPGDSVENISIQIIDDFDLEVDEDIALTLSNPINASLGLSSTTFTINDNDASGTNGPGGVRSAVDYAFWLRADKIVYSDTASNTLAADGQNAEGWVDFSGNGNDAYGDDLLEPVYNDNPTDNVNGKQAIGFDGSDTRMTIINADEINNLGPYTNKTIVAAFQLGSDVASKQMIYEQGGGTNGFAIYVYEDSVFLAAWESIGTGSNEAFDTVSAPVVQGQTVIAIIDYNQPNGTFTGYVNGVFQNNKAVLYNGIPSHGGEISIGDDGGSATHPSAGAGDENLDGKVMELFSFNGNYNETQRIIVENYLAAKYNADISAGSNDYFAYSGTHSYGVAGIGRVSSTDFYPKATSDSMITISNASNLGDGEFFIFGNNNGSIATYTTTEAPTGMVRLAREWRITETGDVGTVSFSFDTTNISASPGSNSQYILMIDSDGNFSSGATYIPLTRNGSTYEANNVNFSNGNHFTIGVINPTVQFSINSDNGSEINSPVQVEVSLNFPLNSDITFDVARTDGTATDATDFNFTDDTFTITGGNLTTDIDIEIINDSQVESDETIELTVSNPSVGQIGTNSIFTYTINDDDNFRKANFVLSDSTDTEDETVQGINVFLNVQDASNETEIYYEVALGSTASNDSIDFYVQEQDTLIFAAGDTLETIPINIIDDAINEFNETIILSLTGGSNATIGDTTEFTFTIQDNDPVPTVQFTSSTKSGSESFQTVELGIELSSVSGKDITLPYSVGVGGDATQDVDFQLLGSSIVIPAGSTTDSLQIIVIDDGQLEVPDETLVIQLDAPAVDEAALGANTSLTYTILDNDGAGIDGPGGVGNIDDQIAVWLRADASINGFNNGNLVTTWQDLTNNDNDGFQDVSSQRPTYLENLMNNRPALVFDGSNDLIKLNDTEDINTGGPYDKKTIYAAFRTGSDIATRQMIYEEGGGARGLSIYIDSDSLFIGGWNEVDDDGGATTPWPSDGSGAPYTLYVSFPIEANTNYFSVLQFDFDADVGFTGEVRGGISGDDPILLDEIIGAGRLFNHPDDIGIGGKNGGTVYYDNNNGGGTQTLNGNISEVFVTNFVFNEAQRRIIANYFSTKYDIDIGVYDIYAYDLNYSYDLFGIGRVNANNVHNQARGTGAVTISNPSDIGNNEFLLIGHNNQAVNQWSSTGVPNNDSDNFRRVPRVWRADETGDIGTISMSIVNTQFIAPPAGFEENYVLMVDSDGDFTSGAQIYQLAENGSNFEVDNIDLGGDLFFTVGLANGVIQFADETSNALETAGTVSIPIETNYIVGTDATVDYSVTGGDASGLGVDYTLTNGTATIPAGSSSTNIVVSLVNDSEVEDTETVEITLSNPSTGLVLGTNTINTLSINDDDQPRKVNFDIAGISNDESVTSYDIVLFLSERDEVNPTEVMFEVTGGTTATEGDDFILADGMVTFPAWDDPSDTVATITLPISDDNIDEDDEVIEVSLVGATNASLGTTTVFTYTIQDNDNAPEVTFNEATDQVIENIGTVNIPVILSASSSRTVTVDYALNGASTAQPGGSDFNLIEGTLEFINGDTVEFIQVTLFNDAIQESDETIIIDLSNEVNASGISPNSSITITVFDDDSGLGPIGPGGVGHTIAGSELAFWLNADQEVFSDAGTTPANNGDDVLQWNDLGNQGNDGVVYTGFNTPSYLASVVAANNKPGISFDAANSEVLNIVNSDLINTDADGYDLKTTFVVFQAPSTLPGLGNRQVIYEQGGGGNGLNIYLEGNGTDADLKFGAWSSWPYDDYAIQNISAGELVFAIYEFDRFNQELRVYAYGSSFGAVTDTTSATGIDDVLLPHGSDIGIGGVNNDTRYSTGIFSGDGDYFDGVIFEIGQFNQRNNNTINRKFIASYVEGRYGLPVGGDYDIFSDANDVAFGENLAGIGQDSTSSRHFSAEALDGIRINTPSDMDDGEYLILTNDGASVAAFDNSGLSVDLGQFVSIVDREWIVEESGDIGQFTFLVDTTTLGVPNHSEYVLIVDNDGDGDYSDEAEGDFTFYRLDDRFGNYAVNDALDLNNGDRFTLGVADNAGSGTGNWSDPDTWLLGEVPASDATVTLITGSDIVIDTDVSITNLTVEAGASLSFAAGGFTLTVNGDFTVNDPLDFTPGDGTVNYASTNGSVCVEGLTYNNLIISGGGTKTLCGDITVNGNLTINNSPDFNTDGANNYQIILLGDWTNAVSASFTPNNGLVVFQGSARQSIIKTGSSETFFDVELDNPADVELGGNISIADNLIFTNGLLFTNSNTVDIENNAVGAIVGSNSSRYIVTNGGFLQHEVATGNSYTFPVGDASNFTPISFDYTSGTVTDLNVSVTNSTHPNIIPSGNYIQRFWTLTPQSGTANYDVAYEYVQSDFSGASESMMKPVKYNSEQIAADGTFTIDDINNIIDWNGLTSFSDFTAGDDEALPVELVDFYAEQSENVINVFWSTATEQNNDYFEVYRSPNGRDFTLIGVVNGVGNSDELVEYGFTDENPYIGTNFYRLKQVDLNGAFDYTKIVKSEFAHEGKLEILLYPNPVFSNAITIQIGSSQPDITGKYRIYSLTGTVLQEGEILSRSTEVDIENLASGAYYIDITIGSEQITSRFIKQQ